MKTIISYAQNREDVILSGFFGDEEKGFYVDIGANDPTHDSVTKAFYDNDWHGINVEPLKQHHADLMSARPKDINLRIGVGDKNGKMTLREYSLGTGLSTVSNTLIKQYESGALPAVGVYEDHEIEVQTLAKIFKDNNVGAISFMKVDVEGFEYEVLSGNDWKRYRPEVLCIEANHIEKDWRPLLQGQNYILAFSDGLNEYYVAAERKDRLEQFSYVETMIEKGVVIPYQIGEQIQEYESLKKKAEEYAVEIRAKNQYIGNLEATISQITPIKRHIRRQIKLRFIDIDSKITKRLTLGNAYKPKAISKEDSSNLQKLKDSDRANFRSYNLSSSRSPALAAYQSVKRVLIGAALKLNRTRRA